MFLHRPHKASEVGTAKALGSLFSNFLNSHPLATAPVFRDTLFILEFHAYTKVGGGSVSMTLFTPNTPYMWMEHMRPETSELPELLGLFSDSIPQPSQVTATGNYFHQRAITKPKPELCAYPWMQRRSSSEAIIIMAHIH